MCTQSQIRGNTREDTPVSMAGDKLVLVPNFAAEEKDVRFRGCVERRGTVQFRVRQRQDRDIVSGVGSKLTMHFVCHRGERWVSASQPVVRPASGPLRAEPREAGKTRCDGQCSQPMDCVIPMPVGEAETREGAC